MTVTPAHSTGKLGAIGSRAAHMFSVLCDVFTGKRRGEDGWDADVSAENKGRCA